MTYFESLFWLVIDFIEHSLLQKLMLQPGTAATKVLCLTQVVTADELRDDEDYADILEDMRLECGKFGVCCASSPIALFYFCFVDSPFIVLIRKTDML